MNKPLALTYFLLLFFVILWVGNTHRQTRVFREVGGGRSLVSCWTRSLTHSVGWILGREDVTVHIMVWEEGEPLDLQARKDIQMKTSEQ